jgi:hypothetical protein
MPAFDTVPNRIHNRVIQIQSRSEHRAHTEEATVEASKGEPAAKGLRLALDTKLKSAALTLSRLTQPLEPCPDWVAALAPENEPATSSSHDVELLRNCHRFGLFG